MIVECIECGEEYQLESGENVFDFQCKCGGDLKETYQKEGSVSLGTGFSDLESMVKTITKDDNVFEGKVKGTQLGETKEIIKDQISDYKDENIDNEDNIHIKSILKQSIDNQKGMRWAISEMINNVDGMTRERAESIARTETVRARNQAELVKAKNTGKEYFIVISAKDCCDKCYNTYNGKVFSVHKDIDKLPPLHKKCKCTSSFFRSESLARGMAEDISKPR